MIRAVLDANVLVSAAIKPGGKSYQIVGQAPERFSWLTSEFILDEVAAVLSRRRIQEKYLARVTREERNRFLSLIRTIATTVEVKTVLNVIRDDENDNPVLACGVDGEADYVVTGDRHLLALGYHKDIQVVTPERFLQVLKTTAA